MKMNLTDLLKFFKASSIKNMELLSFKNGITKKVKGIFENSRTKCLVLFEDNTSEEIHTCLIDYELSHEEYEEYKYVKEDEDWWDEHEINC